MYSSKCTIIGVVVSNQCRDTFVSVGCFYNNNDCWIGSIVDSEYNEYNQTISNCFAYAFNVECDVGGSSIFHDEPVCEVQHTNLELSRLFDKLQVNATL